MTGDPPVPSRGTTVVSTARVGACPPVVVMPVPVAMPRMPALPSVMLPVLALVIRPGPTATLNTPELFSVTLPFVPPPVRPVPAVTPVMVPPPLPGNVWPGANVTMPFGATERPVGPGALFPAPNRSLRFAEGVPPSTFNACQRKVWLLAEVPLDAEAIRSRGFEGDPDVCEFPVAGKAAPPPALSNPPADRLLLNIPAEACRFPLKFAVVPVRPPVNAPPDKGRKVPLT